MAKVRVWRTSGSPSAPVSVRLLRVSSAVVTLCAVAIGVSLTGVTLIVTVAAVEVFGSGLPAVVPLSVTLKAKVNDTPIATAQSDTTAEDTLKSLTHTGADG